MNPFPLNIVRKVNSPELEAYLAQFGHALYADQNDINKMTDALNYLYENLNNTTNVQQLIDASIDVLQDSVPTTGNTLNKLYQMILGLNVEVVVATISERNAYNIPHLPFSIFVENDGDGKWAKYQAISLGTNANFIKLSDPDLLNAVMSAAAIKLAYESNSNTNAFTDQFKNKINGLTKKYISANRGNEVTSSNELIVGYVLIPARDIPEFEVLNLYSRISKLDSNGNVTMKVYINSSLTIGGQNAGQVITTITSTKLVTITRRYEIRNNLIGIITGNNVTDGALLTNQNISEFPFNRNIDNYFIVTINPISPLDRFVFECLQIN